jgi:hypothetical protein
MGAALRSPVAAVFAAATACCALVSCGGSGSADNDLAARSPTQVMAAAQRAAVSAASVHVRGSILNAGKPISLDVELVTDKGGKGRLVADGRRVDVVNVDSDIYINGNGAFYRHAMGGSDTRALQGRWLKASQASGDLAPLATVTTLAPLMRLALGGHGTLTDVRRAVVDGRRAVAVTDPAAHGTLYVSATGTPYPIEIDRPDGGRVSFSDWNQPVSLSVPSGAVNVKQVRAGS